MIFSPHCYLNYLAMRHTRAFASSFGTRLTALAADSKQAAAATQLLRFRRHDFVCARLVSCSSFCCCCCCWCWLQASLLRGSDRHMKLCPLQSDAAAQIEASRGVGCVICCCCGLTLGSCCSLIITTTCHCICLIIIYQRRRQTEATVNLTLLC